MPISPEEIRTLDLGFIKHVTEKIDQELSSDSVKRVFDSAADYIHFTFRITTNELSYHITDKELAELSRLYTNAGWDSVEFTLEGRGAEDIYTHNLIRKVVCEFHHRKLKA